jgi:hypothetical protein
MAIRWRAKRASCGAWRSTGPFVSPASMVSMTVSRLLARSGPSGGPTVWTRGRPAPATFAPNGFVVTALQAALAAIWHTPIPEDRPCRYLAAALETAVRIGDDTDTVAAIAGALLGAGGVEHGTDHVEADASRVAWLRGLRPGRTGRPHLARGSPRPGRMAGGGRPERLVRNPDRTLVLSRSPWPRIPAWSWPISMGSEP